jgi:hypothetical protein
MERGKAKRERKQAKEEDEKKEAAANLTGVLVTSGFFARGGLRPSVLRQTLLCVNCVPCGVVNQSNLISLIYNSLFFMF